MHKTERILSWEELERRNRALNILFFSTMNPSGLGVKEFSEVKEVLGGQKKQGVEH